MIVIRGYKHLHECAYIGDNSSEELDELVKALNEKHDGKSNEPLEMLRHRIDVQFHHESRNNATSPIMNGLDTSEITDPKQIKELLNMIKILKREYQNTNQSLDDNKNSVHVHRNSTVAQEEKDNLKFVNGNNYTKVHATESEEVLHDTLQKLYKLGSKGETVLNKLNKHFRNETAKDKLFEETPLNMKGRTYVKPQIKYSDNIDSVRQRRDLIISTIAEKLNKHDEENDVAAEIVSAANIFFTTFWITNFVQGFIPDGIADHRGTINETTLNDKSNSEFWSSFSSSEEALLNCAGLILNLPLTPHKQCVANLSEENISGAYLENTVTYK